MKLSLLLICTLLFLFACENPEQNMANAPIPSTPNQTDTVEQHHLKNDTLTEPNFTEEVYTITFAEWYDKSTNVTCIVVREDSLFTIINDGSLNGNKNDTIDTGIIKTHLKTKKTILRKKPEDIHAPEIGGCSDGPRVIDLVNKIIEFC